VPKKQANPIDGHVGNRMRLRRMLIGLSQERMGEMLGLTFQQVQKYEKGVNRIGAGRLYQIADILSVPVSYFYEGFVGADKAHAANDDTATKPVMEFLSSGEGLQLTLAFMRIKDGKVRKRVIDLIKSLSDGVEPPPPEAATKITPEAAAKTAPDAAPKTETPPK
jgi:transcriptional regulator with XRE-family HTH domain